jgi:hypothetical protein
LRTLSCIAAIDKARLHRGVFFLGCGNDSMSGISVLHAGGGDRHRQEQAQGINHEVALTPLDLLAGIEAVFAALRRTACGLRIQHCRRWCGGAVLSLAPQVAQAIVHLLALALLAPSAKGLVDVVPMRKITLQHCLAHGVRPSHLDSHQHVHTIWPIYELVARFAAEQAVPLRLARNLGGNIGPAKRLFKMLLNQRLRRLAGRCAEHVCTPADLRDQPLPAQGTLEVIVHLCALGEDFGDDHLDAEESLSALLDRCLAGVPRIAYSALTEL